MDALKENLGKDSRIQYVNAAVSNESAYELFYVYAEQGGINSLLPDLGEPLRKVAVPTVTLNKFCEDHKIGHVHLVKIDTEGNDFYVIDGAIELLREGRVSVIQFEYNWRWIAGRHYLKDVFDLVQDLDYCVGKLTPTHIEVFEKWHPELERFFEANYVLVHKSARSWFKTRSAKADQSGVLIP